MCVCVCFNIHIRWGLQKNLCFTTFSPFPYPFSFSVGTRCLWDTEKWRSHSPCFPLQLYLAARPLDGELVLNMHQDGAPETPLQFRAVFRWAVAIVGWHYDQFPSHSFRTGTASSAAGAGLSLETGRAIGWCCSCALGHIFIPCLHFIPNLQSYGGLFFLIYLLDLYTPPFLGQLGTTRQLTKQQQHITIKSILKLYHNKIYKTNITDCLLKLHTTKH